MSIIGNLVRAVPQSAKRAAALYPTGMRLRMALETPPVSTRYVAPSLRRLDAIVFAARGYLVTWQTPPPPIDRDNFFAGARALPSAVLTYSSLTEGGIPTFIELPTVFPGEVHRAASWLTSSRSIGWRFAWFQIKREVPWVQQARERFRRKK